MGRRFNVLQKRVESSAPENALGCDPVNFSPLGVTPPIPAGKDLSLNGLPGVLNADIPVISFTFRGLVARLLQVGTPAAAGRSSHSARQCDSETEADYGQE